jgi:hypothetical protein
VTTTEAPNCNLLTDLSSDPGLHRLWSSMLRRSWTALAIVPTEADGDVEYLADTLVELGRQHGATRIRRLNAIGARPDEVQAIRETMRKMSDHGIAVIIPLDPIAENPAALPIVYAASTVLMVVRLRVSLLASVRHTIEAVGRDRVIGSIALG